MTPFRVVQKSSVRGRWCGGLEGLGDVLLELGLDVAPYSAFIGVIDRDAKDAQAAVRMVLAQPSIHSQMIDNLNANIHVRALLTDARPRLPAIKARTTVLYAYDPTMGVPPSAVDSMYSGAYRDLAGVVLKRIDESYHFIMLDQPEAFLREVDMFLR